MKDKHKLLISYLIETPFIVSKTVVKYIFPIFALYSAHYIMTQIKGIEYNPLVWNFYVFAWLLYVIYDGIGLRIFEKIQKRLTK